MIGYVVLSGVTSITKLDTVITAAGSGAIIQVPKCTLDGLVLVSRFTLLLLVATRLGVRLMVVVVSRLMFCEVGLG